MCCLNWRQSKYTLRVLTKIAAVVSSSKEAYNTQFGVMAAEEVQHELLIAARLWLRLESIKRAIVVTRKYAIFNQALVHGGKFNKCRQLAYLMGKTLAA